MAMKTEYQTIAHQYAEAVLELAFQSGDGISLCERILTDLASVNKTIDSDQELKLALEHPSLPGAQRKKSWSSFLPSI